jgi:hypothetical protein
VTALDRVIAAELDRPPPAAAQAIVAALTRAHGGAIAAILFYGSCRRTGDVAGLLDLTVLHDGHFAFHRRAMPALFNALLPPNVTMVAAEHGGIAVRAKVAVMSLGQFERRMRPGAVDTTVWARFCQPASLLHARDARVRARVSAAIKRGIGTASLWAVRLGPPSGSAGAFWSGLFARTYGVELRPEPAGRPALIYGQGQAWFDAVLPPGLAGLGIDPRVDAAGVLHPAIAVGRRWRAAWSLRVVAGRALNAMRLVKAAFTFADGAEYVAWKIERHTGVRLEVSAWQRRHPLIGAPALLVQWLRKTSP